jgi:hypothetical protein
MRGTERAQRETGNRKCKGVQELIRQGHNSRMGYIPIANSAAALDSVHPCAMKTAIEADLIDWPLHLPFPSVMPLSSKHDAERGCPVVLHDEVQPC